MLLEDSNRKLYTIYRMVPLSMTLSDLCPRFQGHDIFWSRISYLKDKITIAQEETVPNIWNATVWWPWLTSKHVTQVCQHQLSFLFVCTVGVRVKTNVNYKWRKGWCFCWTVSERSLWYDGTRHVRPIRNFQIGTSHSNWIRIETSDSNLNQISKLRRSLTTLLVIPAVQK